MELEILDLCKLFLGFVCGVITFELLTRLWSLCSNRRDLNKARKARDKELLR